VVIGKIVFEFPPSTTASAIFGHSACRRNIFPLPFSLLARLSQDSNILRTFVIDGEGLHDVSFILVHALSCDAESGKEERRVAVMTASATCGHVA